jgi:GNAT superfamily N-acetyltransferase
MQKAFLLNDLYVHPAGRKKGIGATLLEAAKQFGRDENAKWLLLSTGSQNFTAQSLYQNNGWIKADDFYYQFSL